MPPLLAYVVTLPFETLMSESKRVTISYLVGRSVATYLTCNGVATKLRKVNRFVTHTVVFTVATSLLSTD